MSYSRFIALLSAALLAPGILAPAPAAALQLSSASSAPAPSMTSSSSPLSAAQLSSGQGAAPDIEYPGYPEIYPDDTQLLEVPVPGYGSREVVISLPENYDPSQSYPVWLAYPGRFISPEHMSTDTGLQQASDAIVAYGRGQSGAWAGAPYADTEMAQDIAYSRAVIDRIGQDHAVDRDRIYAIGHSNGGGFALALACYAPDLVAGVASVSGIYYNPGTPVAGECEEQPVPTLIIHSRNDGLSLLEGGSAHEAPYVGARDMAATWAKINGCRDTTSTRAIAPGVVHHTRLYCEADTGFILSDSDGHGWPQYAAFEAWDFLSMQKN